MVKLFFKFTLYVFLLSVFCITDCNNDFMGTFTSSDLDERLAAKDNFNYLGARGGTALALKDKNDYSFIVFADTHIEDGNAWELEKLADFIRQNKIDKKIEFAVILGDITQSGSAQDINKFIEIADSFGIPCYPVIGNHDIYFNNWTVWKELIGSTNYKIKGDGINLFILDTANSFLGNQQLTWLENEIKSTNGKVFVFTHCSFFVKGPSDMQQLTDTRERARVISMLKNKCDVVFMGHAHKRYINEAGNVKYLAIEDYKDQKAYCLVTVKGSVVSCNFEK